MITHQEANEDDATDEEQTRQRQHPEPERATSETSTASASELSKTFFKHHAASTMENERDG